MMSLRLPTCATTVSLLPAIEYDGKIHHQPAQNRSNAKWRVLRIHLEHARQPCICVYGNGRANSIGVQPMRISADPLFSSAGG